MTLRSHDGRWTVGVVRISQGGKSPSTPYYRVKRDGKFFRYVRSVAELEALGIVLAELVETQPALDESAEEGYRREQADPELRPDRPRTLVLSGTNAPRGPAVTGLSRDAVVDGLPAVALGVAAGPGRIAITDAVAIPGTDPDRAVGGVSRFAGDPD